jgi:5-formyltetrahydrofolate cyclo-ligase
LKPPFFKREKSLVNIYNMLEIETGRRNLLENEVLKRQLRIEVIKERNALSPVQAAEKSAAIANRLITMDEYRNARVIMAYLDCRSEVRTGELIVRALADGKNVAVPVTDTANRSLTPSLTVNYPGELHPGPWGIPEPGPQALRPLDPVSLDIVITPGVVFDMSGYRIGYGYGYYDRFLRRTGQKTISIGLAFELQLRPNAYPGPHDVPVHFILTEERLLRVR